MQTEVITLGCRLNAFESEVIRGHSHTVGLENAVIINTCAVTAEAERQARKTIRRIRRERPNAQIIVTGCAAQLNSNKFSMMQEVDKVIGNEEKLLISSYQDLSSKPQKVNVSDIQKVKKIPLNLIKGLEGRSRAFVQVQQGCDHRCTFCIIPFARGPNRSLPFSEICKQVKTLVAHGYKEVVLTGVDICSYGVDLFGRPQLGNLIKDLLAHVPDLPRLRLSSIDPAIIDPLFFKVFRDEERLMPHLHLSLQAMDPMVLKRMRRRHTVKQVLRFAEDMRKVRPDIVFGADLIAGFPTETVKMFRNSVRGIKEVGITYLHVFPYSERPGTPAMRMPQIEKSIRKQRAAILRKKAIQSRRSFFNSLRGKSLEVLTETNNRGLTKQFVPVKIETSPEVILASGQMLNVTISNSFDQSVSGLPIL